MKHSAVSCTEARPQPCKPFLPGKRYGKTEKAKTNLSSEREKNIEGC
jgi:hypothetical protein